MRKILFLIELVMALALSTAAIAVSYETNISEQPITPAILKDAKFTVRSLKYEPYPVNPGDWFNVWIKVENIGQNDAEDAKFELLPRQPFMASENLSLDYGVIRGKINAQKFKRPDESVGEDNIVVLKYRVKMADNAEEGEHIMKFSAQPSPEASKDAFDIPIVADKTKTDFEISMQDSTSKRTSFAVANTGEKTSEAVAVTIVDKSIVDGASSAVIGKLEPGDFTTVSFPVIPNEKLHAINMQISYTDTAGIRNTIEKNVPVRLGSGDAQKQVIYGAPEIREYIAWLNIIIGLIAGIVLSVIVSWAAKKKHSK